jgi:hypothetical protein
VSVLLEIALLTPDPLRVRTYERLAELIQCRSLTRADPDYAEHRAKRVSMNC